MHCHKILSIKPTDHGTSIVEYITKDGGLDEMDCLWLGRIYWNGDEKVLCFEFKQFYSRKRTKKLKQLFDAGMYDDLGDTLPHY